jgi:S1-C subfamily serine protease
VPARVRGSGFCDDVAVAQLTEIPDGIQEATFGDSDAVSNQDQVVALGYPASFQDFFTGSIVSTDGTVQSPSFENANLGPASPVYAELIQHSATINPGNSGGPLYNDRAELIGINTLKNHGTQGEVEGQFYAITSNHARSLIDDLEAKKVTDDVGWDIDPFAQVPLSRVFPAIGYGTAEQGEQADMQLAQAGIDGLWVWGVTPGSPADKGQITGGDLIATINGTPVRTIPDVCDVLKSASRGDTLGVQGYYIVSGPFGEPWQTRVKLRK